MLQCFSELQQALLEFFNVYRVQKVKSLLVLLWTHKSNLVTQNFLAFYRAAFLLKKHHVVKGFSFSTKVLSYAHFDDNIIYLLWFKKKKKRPLGLSIFPWLLSFLSSLRCYWTKRPAFPDLTLNSSAPESTCGIFNCNFYSIHCGCRHFALHTISESIGSSSDKIVSLGGKA